MLQEAHFGKGGRTTRVNTREDSSASVWVRMAEVLKGDHTEDQCSMVKKKNANSFDISNGHTYVRQRTKQIVPTDREGDEIR